MFLTADFVAANCAQEKKLSVVPSLELVATRLGKLPGSAERGLALRFGAQVVASAKIAV